MFLQPIDSTKYPLLVKRLISFAAHRLANSTEFQETQIKGEITHLNWLSNKALTTSPLMRRADEFPYGILIEDLISSADNRYYDAQLAIRECQIRLQSLKRSLFTKPCNEHYIEAEKEVAAYLQHNIVPNHLSKRERWLLSNLQEFKVPEDWEYLGSEYQALTEPVLKIIKLKGNPVSYTTRNSYGVLCLNAPRIMFVDIDTATRDDEVAHSSNPWGDFHATEEQVFDAIAETTRDFSLRFEMYRTCKGFRLLEMSRLWDPLGAESSTVLERMGCDRLYQKLCIIQNCYRARLEIKPWRFGDTVCHHVSSIGVKKTIPEAIAVKAVHDEYCLGNGELA